MAQIDLRNTTIRFSDGGSNYIDVSIGEGTLNFIVKREIEVVKNRGRLDTIRENEEIPLEVELSFIWEFLLGAAGDPPTVEDVLYNRGEAASWTTVSSDGLAPYCINISIRYLPACEEIQNEIITFRQFHFQELNHDLKNAAVALKGLCNVKASELTRPAL